MRHDDRSQKTLEDVYSFLKYKELVICKHEKEVLRCMSSKAAFLDLLQLYADVMIRWTGYTERYLQNVN